MNILKYKIPSSPSFLMLSLIILVLRYATERSSRLHYSSDHSHLRFALVFAGLLGHASSNLHFASVIAGTLDVQLVTGGSDGRAPVPVLRTIFNGQGVSIRTFTFFLFFIAVR